MDHFEGIVATLLEADGYWVRRSFKVNVTKEEKRLIGKHSIPRPEIDLLALNFAKNEVIAFEAKSFLDSPGVNFKELSETHDIPEGRYKLFTSVRYRSIVFKRLLEDLISLGMADASTEIRLGLAAGNVHKEHAPIIRDFMQENEWLFWSPDDIKAKVTALAEKRYENDASIITAKILMR